MTFEDASVRIAKYLVGPYGNNVYVVSCVKTNRAVLIDAAASADEILAEASEYSFERILVTHGHFDHIDALDTFRDRLSVPWAMHPDDVEIAGRVPDEMLGDGQSIRFGEVAIHVIHTPGHTPGSVCFVIEPVVLSGDTLFPGGPGATRWEYSSFGQIMDSIEARLMRYPDTTLVYPGHGDPTTIGTERAQLPSWRVRGW